MLLDGVGEWGWGGANSIAFDWAVLLHKQYGVGLSSLQKPKLLSSDMFRRT